MSRTQWTQLSDDQLLAQCAVDTYRASGPGGQKRNKTSSAVRLRHEPSGMLVIAEESRSQHENKARALKRLKQCFFLHWREPVPDRADWAGMIAQAPEMAAVKNPQGRLAVGPKQAPFWPAVGLILDVMDTMQAKVSEAAKLLGVSTANLVEFLEQHPKVWAAANQLRTKHGHKQLKLER